MDAPGNDFKLKSVLAASPGSAVMSFINMTQHPANYLNIVRLDFAEMILYRST